MYCLEKTEGDKNWILPAIFVISAILLTHPSQAFKIGIMLFIYFIIKSFYCRSFQTKVGAALVGGFIVSLIWWSGSIASVIGKHISKVTNSQKYSEIVQGAQSSLWGKLKLVFPYNQGTATRPYTFDDFFVAEPFGMINVHVGWGIVISLLLALGIVYLCYKYKTYLVRNKKNYWIAVTLGWFIFTFLGTNSMTFNLPIGLFAFRFWLILAIPVALLSWFGIELLLDIRRKINVPVPTILILALTVIGIIITSTSQKYNQNATAQWPPGQAWPSPQELEAYIYLKTLPPGTRIFSYSGKGAYILGIDQWTCEWCQNEVELRKILVDIDANQLYVQLKNNNYEYLMFEVSTIKLFTRMNLTQEEAIQKTNEKLKQLVESNKFIPTQSFDGGGVLFKLN